MTYFTISEIHLPHRLCIGYNIENSQTDIRPIIGVMAL